MLKKLAYLSILASLLGSNYIAINLGLLNLSIYRTLIIGITVIITITILIKTKYIKATWNEQNGYSIAFMMFWLFYAIVSIVWVKDYSTWIQAVFYLTIGIFSILIYNKYFRSIYDIITAFQVMSLMIIVHNLIGWFELSTGNYLFLSNSVDTYRTFSYPVSIFGNTNNFALFMLLSIFILYICLVNSKLYMIKILYILTIFSSLVLLLMTTSRASILGLIISILFFILLVIRTKHGRKILFSITLVLTTLYFLNSEILESFLFQINSNLNFNRIDVSGSSELARLNLIKNGILFLFSTFGFGTGAGNITYWMLYYSIYPTWGVLSIHNWWFEILVSYGLIIFILYIVFYIKLFRTFYENYRGSKDITIKSISIGCMCCMIAFIFGSFGASSLITVEWLWVFWGILISAQGIIKNKKRNHK